MIEQLTEKCQNIRENLIKVVSKNGGHLGPNLGIVELTVCLNEIFDFKKDIMLFDVGHQAYVYKILTDREDRFHTIMIISSQDMLELLFRQLLVLQRPIQIKKLLLLWEMPLCRMDILLKL